MPAVIVALSAIVLVLLGLVAFLIRQYLRLLDRTIDIAVIASEHTAGEKAALIRTRRVTPPEPRPEPRQDPAAESDSDVAAALAVARGSQPLGL